MPPSGYFSKYITERICIIANSIYKTRTNYVHVTDIERFKEIIRLCTASEGERLHIITRNDDNGKQTIGFYVEGDVEGYSLDEDGNIVDPDTNNFDAEGDYEADYDRFIEDIQSVLDPTDAFIITRIGYEKMRWLIGDATIVTRNRVKYISLETTAILTTREMLNAPKWTTEMNY